MIFLPASASARAVALKPPCETRMATRFSETFASAHRGEFNGRYSGTPLCAGLRQRCSARSISAQARLRELLDRSKEGTLTEAEKNELDEMRHLDHLVSSKIGRASC